MEELILPRLTVPSVKTRARDELPQSAAGRTIMTTEPKFIPETAVTVELEGGAASTPASSTAWAIWWKGPWATRRTRSPAWSRAPGSRRRSPSTWPPRPAPARSSGTTPPSPRHHHRRLHQRHPAGKIQGGRGAGHRGTLPIHKPFVILLNCVDPAGEPARRLARQMEEEYGHTVLPVSCVDLDAAAIDRILQSVLYEFDVKEIAFAMPRWITMLERTTGCKAPCTPPPRTMPPPSPR